MLGDVLDVSVAVLALAEDGGFRRRDGSLNVRPELPGQAIGNSGAIIGPVGEDPGHRQIDPCVTVLLFLGRWCIGRDLDESWGVERIWGSSCAKLPFAKPSIQDCGSDCCHPVCTLRGPTHPALFAHAGVGYVIY